MELKKYEYQRIGHLAQQLEIAGIDRGIIDQIMEGGENILRKTSPEKKADWLRGAMIRMNRLLDSEIRKTVREGCACCLGGQRLKISRSIAKENETIEARIKAANDAKLVFGNSVSLKENGEVLVRFFPEGLEQYRCVCLPKAKEPLPITYCYCCGGHVKHHLQIVLGQELDCTVLSSALSSGGKFPCTFSFRIIEQVNRRGNNE
ncbi:MAG: DUF6144 family protein [Dehalococcoidia bacterium]|jgi:hypothetical protein